ncbi:MAG: hypothetical protein M0R06_27035 [Sphaerochaeta sp.]|jgi:hypothetical protein|nr:hypothetical protein [Sphaerochaeta sp.]
MAVPVSVQGLGIRVSRAAAADPQNAWQTLFTISGGAILLTALVGARTVIQAGGASTMQFRHSIGPTVLDAGTAAITGDDVLTAYWLTGDTTDPIQVGVVGAPVMAGRVVATSTTYGSPGLFVLSAGNVQVTMTAAVGTGSTGYTLCYIPLASGARVVAA